MEKKVETVDYRSSAGQGQEERNVQVIHQPHSTNTSGGVLAGAAAAVASTLQSAQNKIDASYPSLLWFDADVTSELCHPNLTDGWEKFVSQNHSCKEGQS
ncbi:unnamed protein product [Sphenostylis stenocarpa]|uniref:Uncharacterized protein n=1 Tax=Sphenostylis stenocarpa TaxID=92480 RepID=A0AA86SHT9_9FABA|nr:unnamed protein product [Sphenostylis stenocarpa]